MLQAGGAIDEIAHGIRLVHRVFRMLKFWHHVGMRELSVLPVVAHNPRCIIALEVT